MNLYLHIPFCASRCSYCDFYKETKQDERLAFLRALETELCSRRSELPEGARVEHIYLGGGTPSQLSISELERLFDTIWRHYPIAEGGEITIECNPDDVTPDYARGLAQLPTNRVSMGVQSFHEADLRFLSRRHSAEQVTAAVDALRSEGLTNLSLDLIYGLPRQTEELWEANIARFLELEVPHLSAYHLIYEEGTALMRLLQAGKVQAVDEEASLRFFELLIQRLKAAGYEHYEISNFARPGCYAQHNTGYWQGVPYLGFGPISRAWSAACVTTRRSYWARRSCSTSTSSRVCVRSGASSMRTMRSASASRPSRLCIVQPRPTSRLGVSRRRVASCASPSAASSSPTASSPTSSSKPQRGTKPWTMLLPSPLSLTSPSLDSSVLSTSLGGGVAGLLVPQLQTHKLLPRLPLSP